MELFKEIIIPVIVFIGLGALMGVMLAVAAKAFAVEKDPRIDKIVNCLPGANCGGCGFPGCAGFAEAVVKGEASPTGCAACGELRSAQICEIMGITAEKGVRMRAQVMCSGTAEYAKKKYLYTGYPDCISAVTLGGGDKLCPNGCIGLGTCVRSCAFDAISVVDGVAVVDYRKCKGCGVCVASCPKKLIELIPYDARHWVACKSVQDAKNTRKSCDVGCFSCRLCEKNCESKAITVDSFVASIDYSKCIDCGVCVSKCPRGIIKSPDWENTEPDIHFDHSNNSTDTAENGGDA